MLDDRKEYLEQLAAEVLVNYKDRIPRIEKAHRMTHNVYFITAPATRHQMGETAHSVLHMFGVDNSENLPLTPEQHVRLQLLWLQDPAYSKGYGVDLDPRKIHTRTQLMLSNAD